MARSFNTNTDFVSWTGGPLLYNQTACSVLCWFKKDTMTASAGGAFVLDFQAAFNKRVHIQLGDGGTTILGQFQVSWRAAGSDPQFDGSGRWDDGNWHRLLYVRRNSSPFTELYVDGVSDGNSTTDPGTDATASAGQQWGNNFQGGDTSSFGSNGNGSIARAIIVAGTTLTPSQADAILFSGVSSIALSQWLEFGYASPEPDFSGNGLVGTVSGTAVVADGSWAPIVLPGSPDEPMTFFRMNTTQAIRRTVYG